MGTAVVVNAIALFLGTVAGQTWWAAVPSMFAVGVVSGMAAGFGTVATNNGFLGSVLFVLGLGVPGDAALGVQHFWLCLTGGALATVLGLVLRPVRPFEPAQQAVAACYRGLGRLVDQRLLASVARSSLVGAGRPAGNDGHHGDAVDEEMPISGQEVRAGLEAARKVLRETRTARAGEDQAAMALVDLTDTAETILDRVLALGEQIDDVGSHDLLGLVEPQLERAVRALQDAMTSIATAIRRASKGGGNVGPSPLDAAVRDVDIALSAQHSRIEADRQDISIVITLRPIAVSLDSIADRCREAAERASGRVRSRLAPPGTQPDAPLGLRLTYQALLARLRENCSPRSPVGRHALRVATVATIAVGISMGSGLSKGYWVPLTVLIILRPYLGVTLERTAWRVGGTVLGGLVAVALLAGLRNPAAMVAAILVITVVALSLIPLNYGAAVVLITPLVVLLLDLDHPGDWKVAVARVINTIVGGALALAGSYLLWPTSDRVQAPLRIADALDADRAFSGTLIAMYEGAGTRSDLVEAHRRAALAADNATAAFQRLLDEPAHKRGDVAMMWRILSANRRLLASFSALEAHLDAYTGKHRLPGLPAFSRGIDRILSDAVSTLRARTNPAEPPAQPSPLAQEEQTDPEAPAAVLQAHVEARRLARVEEVQSGSQGVTLLAEEVRDEWLVGREAGRIVEALEGLRRALE